MDEAHKALNSYRILKALVRKNPEVKRSIIERLGEFAQITGMSEVEILGILEQIELQIQMDRISSEAWTSIGAPR